MKAKLPYNQKVTLEKWMQLPIFDSNKICKRVKMTAILGVNALNAIVYEAF